MAVSVETEKGVYVLAGDLVLLRESFNPDPEKGWPLTPPGRYYNMVEIWKSIEEVQRRADFVLLTHEPDQLGREIYP
jgi:hypothetical protein